MNVVVHADTSYLITFTDAGRPNHQAALAYYEYCARQGVAIVVSTVAAAEFAVKQPVALLEEAGFLLKPFELQHAVKAAAFSTALRTAAAPKAGPRQVIINDLHILGQAEADGISYILTEDQNTLARLATQLRFAGLSSVEALLLSDSFDSTKLAALLPAQP